MIFIWDMDSNALNITQMAQWMARYGDLAVKSRVHAAADLARAPELARFRLHCLQPPFAADLKPSQFRRTYPRSIKKSLILGLSPPLCKNTVQNRISNCTTPRLRFEERIPAGTVLFALWVQFFCDSFN
jgi:hypothetical protein